MMSLVNTSMVEYDGDTMVGVLSGSVQRMIGTGDLTWNELLFYVDRKHRMSVPRMIEDAKRILKEAGMVWMTMGLAEESKRCRHLYKKRGFKLLDAHYCTRL
jgi:hypothetical protein